MDFSSFFPLLLIALFVLLSSLLSKNKKQSSKQHSNRPLPQKKTPPPLVKPLKNQPVPIRPSSQKPPIAQKKTPPSSARGFVIDKKALARGFVMQEILRRHPDVF